MAKHKYQAWVGSSPMNQPVNKLLVLVRPTPGGQHVHLPLEEYGTLSDYLPFPATQDGGYYVSRVADTDGKSEFMRMVLTGEWADDIKKDIESMRFAYDGEDTSRLVSDKPLPRSFERWKPIGGIEIFKVSARVFCAKIMFKDRSRSKSKNVDTIGAFWCWPL